jgi:hypothetical protein
MRGRQRNHMNSRAWAGRYRETAFGDLRFALECMEELV